MFSSTPGRHPQEATAPLPQVVTSKAVSGLGRMLAGGEGDRLAPSRQAQVCSYLRTEWGVRVRGQVGAWGQRTAVGRPLLQGP